MRTGLVYGAAALALALGACTLGSAEEAGRDVTRGFPVGGFTRLEVAGPFDVSVTTGGQPTVSARGPSAIVEKMVVEVDGDTLRIHPEKRRGVFNGWNWGDHEGTVRVAVAVPMLNAASVAGSGDITVNRIATDRFKGEVAGSGGLKLAAVNVQDLELGIAGSGGVTAAGRAARAKYEIAGSGDIEAGQLAAQQASAGIAGSGNIHANASSTAKVDIAGSGNVRVSGGAECSVSKAGSGNVSCS